MAGTTTIEDILSSEVDETAVTALIGSLETKLASQNTKAGTGQVQDVLGNRNHVSEGATPHVQTGPGRLTTAKTESEDAIRSNTVHARQDAQEIGIRLNVGLNQDSGSTNNRQNADGTNVDAMNNKGVHVTSSSSPSDGVQSVANSNASGGQTRPAAAKSPTNACVRVITLPATGGNALSAGNTQINNGTTTISSNSVSSKTNDLGVAQGVAVDVRTTGNTIDQQNVKVVAVQGVQSASGTNVTTVIPSSAVSSVQSNVNRTVRDQLVVKQQVVSTNDQSGAMKPRIVVQPSVIPGTGTGTAQTTSVAATLAGLPQAQNPPPGSVAVGGGNQKVVTINVANPAITSAGRPGQYVMNTISGTPKAVTPQPMITQTVRMQGPHHMIAPRAQVGSPMQIRLPPGTSLPPGVVLINKGGTVQAVMGNPAIQARVAATGVTYRHVQPGTQIVNSNNQPNRVLSTVSIAGAPVINSPHQALNTMPRPSSPVVISSNTTAMRGTPPAGSSVASSNQAPSNTMPARTSVTVLGKTTTSSSTSASGGPPVGLSSAAMDNVKKCKNFLTTLIRLASNANQPPQTVQNVKTLVQNLIDAKIEPEEFTLKLQKELNSSPQPYLVPFLKRSLPLLRQTLQRGNTGSNIQGLMGPLPASVASTSLSSSSASSSDSKSALKSAVSAASSKSAASVTTVGPNSVSSQGKGTSSAKQLQQMSQKHQQNKSSKSSSPGSSPSHQSKSSSSKSSKSSSSSQSSGSKSSSRSSGSKSGSSKSSGGRSTPSRKDKSKDNSTSFSTRDDDDINDVASMAGVNLSEESARILATNEAFVGTQLRSCKDEKFLHLSPLQRRMSQICAKHGISDAASEVLDLVSLATQDRLKNIVEKLSVIAQHRLEIYRTDSRYEVMSDVRSQMKFFEQLDALERKRRDEQEREILLRAAKSRSKQEDPEQLRLKQKAKEMQQMELEQLRQQEANQTALAAIGPRKKRKLDSPTPNTTQGASGSSSLLSSLSSPGSNTTPFLRTQFRRIKRVNIRDVLFLLEQEPETKKSQLLYRTYLK